MNTKNNITPLKYILIVLSIFTIFSILQYFLMQENTSWLYGYIILFLPIIMIIIGYRKAVLRLFHYFCYFISSNKEKYSYTNEITREKWFLSIISLVASITFTLLLPNTKFLSFDSSWAYLFRNSMLLSLILGLSYISYCYHIKDLNRKDPKITTQSIQADTCILLKDNYDLNNIFELLIENNYIKGSLASFERFIHKEALQLNGKLQWHYKGDNNNASQSNKQALIRFICILFNFDPDDRGNSQEIKSIIDTYFTDINNNIIGWNEKLTEISQVKKEKREFVTNHQKNNELHDNNYTRFYNKLMDLFFHVRG